MAYLIRLLLCKGTSLYHVVYVLIGRLVLSHGVSLEDFITATRALTFTGHFYSPFYGSV